jgi:uncharacterized protein (TIGR03000 family)
MYSVVLLAAMTTATESPDCWFHSHASCSGSCYGTCCGGCCGTYSGCCGSCYGSSCWGSSCYGSYSSCCGYGYNYSCHGCYGCGGCYGSCVGSYYMVAPVVPMGSPKEPVDKPKDKEESLVPAKAKLTVQLPADAKLYIDDQPIKMSSPVRQFNTPELQPGQTYYYMVRVEVVTDKSPQTVTRRVLIKPGEDVIADFTDMKAPVATVKK